MLIIRILTLIISIILLASQAIAQDCQQYDFKSQQYLICKNISTQNNVTNLNTFQNIYLAQLDAGESNLTTKTPSAKGKFSSFEEVEEYAQEKMPQCQEIKNTEIKTFESLRKQYRILSDELSKLQSNEQVRKILDVYKWDNIRTIEDLEREMDNAKNQNRDVQKEFKEGEKFIKDVEKIKDERYKPMKQCFIKYTSWAEDLSAVSPETCPNCSSFIASILRKFEINKEEILAKDLKIQADIEKIEIKVKAVKYAISLAKIFGIDLDEGVPKPAVPEPSVPEPSVPKPSVPKPSVPEPAVPEPAVPEPAIPKPPVPKPPVPKPPVPKPPVPKPSVKPDKGQERERINNSIHRIEKGIDL